MESCFPASNLSPFLMYYSLKPVHLESDSASSGNLLLPLSSGSSLRRFRRRLQSSCSNALQISRRLAAMIDGKGCGESPKHVVRLRGNALRERKSEETPCGWQCGKLGPPKLVARTRGNCYGEHRKLQRNTIRRPKKIYENLPVRRKNLYFRPSLRKALNSIKPLLKRILGTMVVGKAVCSPDRNIIYTNVPQSFPFLHLFQK